MMRVRYVVLLCSVLCISAQAQVLQPLGSGLPAKVVASFAAGKEYLALFEETSTAEVNDFTMARWNGVNWSYYSGLTTPAPVKTVKGTYNFHSIALYKDTMYAAAYMANAERDADVPVSHLYKWNGLKWVPEVGVVDTKNNGIIAMTVFDNKLIVAGLFDNTVNGSPVQNIAAYNGTNWSYLGNSGTSQGTDGAIRSLAVVGNRLYIGGDFQTFAGSTTGNIAYYTAANGGWGGVGSPFVGEILELGVFDGKIAALGRDANAAKKIAVFQGTWSPFLGFDTFSSSEPKTLMGSGTDLLIGGSFVKNGNGTSLLVYDGTSMQFTGNRITGDFTLGQRGDGAFIWGDFREHNTDLQYFSKIEPESGNLVGDLFYDINSNCIKDDGEVGLKSKIIRLENKTTGEINFAVTDVNGHFTIALGAGDYDLQTVAGKHLYSVCLGNGTARIRKGVYSYVALGQYQLPSLSDMEVGMDVIVPAAAVAGDDAKVLVKIVNHGGTAITNGTVHLKHPASISYFQSQPEPDNYTSGEAIYAIGNLPAFGTQYIEIYTRIPVTATGADQYEFSIKTGTGILQKDADVKDNEAKDVVSLSRRGGLVEVMKRSLQGDTVDFRSKEWEYRVDFRNVSTSMVKRAVLVDTLDANLPLLRLELLSFYPSKASYSIEKGRVLVIDYPEANLSAFEMNPAGSVGFAKYRVQIYQTLPQKTVINNRAMVDFDSKWQAYSTNCAVSLLDKFAGLKVLNSTLSIYPNPARSEFVVALNQGQLGLPWQLINHMGMVVREGQCEVAEVRVEVRDLTTGLYTLRLGNASATVMVQ
jgi:hypothetical protein